MKVEMKEDKHLWITVDPDHQIQVIIDRDENDIRVQVGSNIVKIQLFNNKLKGILLNDIYIKSLPADFRK